MSTTVSHQRLLNRSAVRVRVRAASAALSALNRHYLCSVPAAILEGEVSARDGLYVENVSEPVHYSAGSSEFPIVPKESAPT